ncbi:hypothetical protein KEJ49_07875, partial [Candidatus Bathyarchaeota archaeon]|nr:hypothetical protein [Candidatus Bathyarchaeota archaeon]
MVRERRFIHYELRLNPEGSFLARVKVMMMGTLARMMGSGNIELTIKPPAEVAQVIHSLSELHGGE